MIGGNNFSASPVPWSLMLEYERTDAVFHLCRQFSFFSADKLTLIEREEVLCTSGMDSEGTDYLVIRGSIGNARSEAFLKLLRLARLTLVQDIASQVAVSPQVGDMLPNAMLHPLWETSQVRSFRKWNCIYWAMRCGLLRKIKRRTEMIQMHVEQIVNSKVKKKDQDSSPETVTRNRVREESYYNSFRELLELEQEEQNAPLELYHSACSEERVNLSTVIAAVPTLIVVWASWDAASMEWLKSNLFNIKKTSKCKNLLAVAPYYYYYSSSSAAAAAVNDDPWLQTVTQFVDVPRFVPVTKRKKLKRYLKRAQIVLISVDSEKTAAVQSLKGLMNEVLGWKSPEVSLIPLWCGPDGLQSELATELNVAVLPFFLATQLPDKKTRKFGDGKFPRICYITAHSEGDITPDVDTENNLHEESHEEDTELVNWHAIEKNKRKSVTSAVSRFLLSSDAPLRFITRVDRSYQMNHSAFSVQVTKCLKPKLTSFASMSGVISTPDLLKLKSEISVLSHVKNFFVDVKIMKPSSPILIELNPKTPTRYILGSARNITCNECLCDILIDKEHYFRCIHCDQKDGVMCWRCFKDEKHPQHHILLRVPAGSGTTLQLLWGPSNVSPLALFSGAFVENVNNTHIGIYCNACSQLICGRRWKCGICYQYDLCDRCDEKSNRRDAFKCEEDSLTHSSNLTSSSPVHTFSSKMHPKEHMFLCIRHGCGVDGDECLSPIMEQCSLPVFISQ